MKISRAIAFAAFAGLALAPFAAQADGSPGAAPQPQPPLFG